jgi:hypothetical protein
MAAFRTGARGGKYESFEAGGLTRIGESRQSATRQAIQCGNQDAEMHVAVGKGTKRPKQAN